MSTTLYLRSEYTLLQSLCPIHKIVKKAREYGYQSLAITDLNILAGASHFKAQCQLNNIKALFGMEVDVLINDSNYRLVLLAKDDDAYLKLMHLATFIDINKKAIDYIVLQEYTDGCFVILESDNMFATSAFLKKDDNAASLLKESIRMFKGEVVVGLFDNDIALNRKLNRQIKDVCKENGIKTVYMMRTLYMEKDDEDAYHILKAIKEKRLFDDPNLVIEGGRYFYHREELEELYDEDDLAYSDYIASKCNVKLNYKTSLPSYKNIKGTSSRDFLINLCKAGLKKRLKGHKNELYERRLNHELKIILSMHFEDYFLIVYDFILYAKKHDILVGPGRGSAAGSLVSYCLGITDIDPIRYGLIFERFLNPERVTMPDIDVDFPDDRRDEVIDYCINRYGKEYIGHIVTYGTLKAKQALRDVGRVLNYPLNEIDALCKLIPNDPKMTLEKAMSIEAFRLRINTNPKYQNLYNYCLKLEGLPRHASTHAAGIVMSKKPLQDIVPLFSLEDNIYTTQITMEYLESFGLIKMDFLGLRNLSILHEIIDDIKKDDNSFDINEIDMNDVKTFKLIQDTNTLGVFQLESSGMQNLIRKLKPESFEEVALTIALFRPGPMANIPLFVENRANKDNIHYLHEDLKPILKETYGIIVYQEQIMMIATKMAGFSMAKADIMRKAMSKKKENELNSLANDFINGCIKNGYSKSLAEEVYNLILKFANYGFNKSHSIAYAKIAYELAYLKANYPLYFYKALLNGVIGSETKTYEYILECQKVNVQFRGFSINHSSDVYIIDKDAILMPLSIIKDVGTVALNNIINDRYINGPYLSYEDAVCRLINMSVNKNIIEKLIMAGAFDEFNYSRMTMKENLNVLVKYAITYSNGQLALGDFDAKPSLVIYKDNLMMKANDEKNTLGFYFSVNPIQALKRRLGIDTLPFSSLNESKGRVRGFGQVSRVKEHRTKKGEWMAFLELHDESSDIDLVVMPNLYRRYQGSIKRNTYLYFEGEIEKEHSCLVKNIKLYRGDEND